MKKYRNILVIIVSWQYLWAVLALSILIVRSIYANIWSDPAWEKFVIEPDKATVIEWRGVSIFSILFVLVNVAVSYGLIKRGGVETSVKRDINGNYQPIRYIWTLFISHNLV